MSSYSWALLTEQARSLQVDLDQKDTSGKKTAETTTRKVWDELSSIEGDRLTTAFGSVTGKLNAAKIKSLSGKDLTPMISVDNKVLVLPSTLVEDPSGLGIAMLRWASFLKYDIREYTVEGLTVKEPEATQSEIGMAFFKSLDDITSSVNVLRKKSNVTEQVRAFVRAQQLIGYVSEVKDLSVDVFKRSHSNFGNNPSETISIQVTVKQFKTEKVEYFKKELDSYWREKKWKERLSQIFVQLIRESWRAIDPEILHKNLESCVLSMDDFVKIYCATPHEEPIKGSKGKTEIHMRVPSKPKENNMMLAKEQQALNALSSDLFGHTYYEDNSSEWVQILLGSGFKETKDNLQNIYKARGEFVRSFASVTTQRLSQIRTHIPDAKTKKKKDVTSAEVTQLLLFT